jgi:hypothetical protein
MGYRFVNVKKQAKGLMKIELIDGRYILKMKFLGKKNKKEN